MRIIRHIFLCPDCEKDQVFEGIVKLKDSCSSCGIDFNSKIIGDGASWITTASICFFLVPLLFFLEIKFQFEPMIYVIFIFPLIILFSIFLLKISRYILLKKHIEIK